MADTSNSVVVSDFMSLVLL